MNKMEINKPPPILEIVEELKISHHQPQLQPGLVSFAERATSSTKNMELVILSIGDMIRKLPQPHSCRCIYKVPDSVREKNPHCYTPRMVSIGPLHHENPRLNSKEDLKLRFFESFLSRDDIREEKDKSLKSALLVENMEFDIRRHYQDEIKLDSKDFCKMILLDAVFIVELLVKKKEKNHIFDNRWWFCDLLNDILLIENQIPLFVPRKIYQQFYQSVNYNFSDLVDLFFKDIKNVHGSPTAEPSTSELKEEPMHFIHYLKMTYIHSSPLNSPATVAPSSPMPMPPTSSLSPLSDPPSSSLSPPSAPPSSSLSPQSLKRKKIWKSDVLTASRLVEYGVKFNVATTFSLVDIKFQKEGALTIPKVKVNEWTENLFRNLVAFEQCDHFNSNYVSDYLIFMDSVIDTPEDVNILIDAGIIQDDLQDPEKVSHMFNNLYKEVITEGRDYLFGKQSRELNEYRRNSWHKWRARWYKWKLILKRDYFNSPWSTLAFVTAAMLLGLTIVQTVCSFYQAMEKKMKL